jgi:voltage-gated potassium channel
MLGLLFLVVLLLPLARPLDQRTQDLLDFANWFLWGIFAIDYAARLWLAIDRAHFARTHILDLFIVIVPPFRLLRLVRLISVFLVLLRRASDVPFFVIPIYVAAITAILVGVSAVLVYDAESTNPDSPISTLGDAVWWAVTTVTTVGYGDEYPTTPLGRVLGSMLMFCGISLLGSLTASAAAWLTTRFRRSDEEVNDASGMTHKMFEELKALRSEVFELRAELRNGRNESSPATTDSRV